MLMLRTTVCHTSHTILQLGADAAQALRRLKQQLEGFLAGSLKICHDVVADCNDVQLDAAELLLLLLLLLLR